MNNVTALYSYTLVTNTFDVLNENLTWDDVKEQLDVVAVYEDEVAYTNCDRTVYVRLPIISDDLIEHLENRTMIKSLARRMFDELLDEGFVFCKDAQPYFLQGNKIE